MKYAKKPVVIDAWQYSGPSTGEEKEIEIIKNLTGCEAIAKNGRIVLPTLEGEHVLSTGDYIIRGVKGEYYPCKPDIFELSYEKVEEIKP